MMLNPPPPIRTDASNAFASHTLRVRLPAIVQQTIDRNPDYWTGIRDALAALRDAMAADAPITPLHLPAPDVDDWAAALAQRPGSRWQAVDWFFAETYAYRQIIQATRWWETGRDPFAPIKAEEYASPALWGLIDHAVNSSSSTPDERLHSALTLALWGNRIDLSYAASREHGTATHADDLIADNRDAAVRLLLDAAPGVRVDIIVDNTGSELAMDLALADALLNTAAARVVLHVKLHPTFVSDATVSDVLALIALMIHTKPGTLTQALGLRLDAALESGRLRLAPDFYWNSSHFLWSLPQRLTETLRGSTLVILKGDANYRRAVGDALWPPETPFGQVVAGFPAPLLALRSLKSDPIVGLAAGQAAQLDAADPAWRTNGKRGVIQLSHPAR